MAVIDTPEPWASAMAQANIGDPRNGRPSVRALARTSGLPVETVRQLIAGRNAEPATVEKVADALHLDARMVAHWIGQARAQREPFQAHVDADLMDKPERDAINRLIGVLTRGRRQRQDESAVEERSAAYPGDSDEESRR